MKQKGRKEGGKGGEEGRKDLFNSVQRFQVGLSKADV